MDIDVSILTLPHGQYGGVPLPPFLPLLPQPSPAEA